MLPHSEGCFSCSYYYYTFSLLNHFALLLIVSDTLWAHCIVQAEVLAHLLSFRAWGSEEEEAMKAFSLYLLAGFSGGSSPR